MAEANAATSLHGSDVSNIPLAIQDLNVKVSGLDNLINLLQLQALYLATTTSLQTVPTDPEELQL